MTIGNENMRASENMRAGGAVEVLARLGYGAKGAVYLAVGVLTAMTALGTGSAEGQSSREALSQVASETWGSWVLGVIGVGLVGYVVWRMVQVFADPEDRGTDAKGLATRAVLFLSGLIYGSLAFWAFKSALGGGGGQGGGSGAESWSATLLQQPFGAWLLGLFGLGVVGYGIAEWVKAYRASFEKRLRNDLDGSARDLVRKVARVGLASRGFVFLIVGGFFVFAAVTADPSRARGLEGALNTLGEQPYGPWIMGVVALGLAAYGGLQVVKAWYRRIGPALPAS